MFLFHLPTYSLLLCPTQWINECNHDLKKSLIKPNDDKVAFQWECQKIVQQLRACGVLETVRISAAGFPSRWTYENFYSRYFLLCKLSQCNDDERVSCMRIVQNYISDEDKYRFGHTQIFFRAGQVRNLTPSNWHKRAGWMWRRVELKQI